MALTFTPEAEMGTSCPDFQLPATDGKIYRRSDFQIGKPVVILFICNHCPYVQAIEDRLIQLGHDLKELGIPMIAISSNDGQEYPEDNFENMRSRAQDKKYSFLYLHDETQEVAQRFGAVCTPDFFVYDSQMNLAYRGRLDDSWKDPKKVTRRELFEAVQLLAQNKALSAKQTPSMGCNIKWINRK
ncbi:MAG: thioredoxin family protein [Bdellovibrio sp. CG10_big_fil_rev_8_21_14_0_10_47_8]|nr:MAG: thioredoxin family protein [Bdellovibrio sp. CG10_big_fil_rev_8_21_14_0_10_47_8]